MAQPIAVFDFETDPFLWGRIPEPFSWGFYDGKEYVDFWGRNGRECVDALLNLLEHIDEPHTIYAHNGGKFDFLFLLSQCRKDIKIVNGRILEARIGKHTLRDSYAILPIALAEYQKDEIDYAKFEKGKRHRHKREILSYLKTDCVSLYQLVDAFRQEFGDVLTIGSASMRQFKTFHQFETVRGNRDTSLRRYYYGGRCQCFETGIIKAPIKIFDVNSMYPHVMRSSVHPTSTKYALYKTVRSKTDFIHWTGKNYGAVPMRTKTGGLDFTIEHGSFFTTIHEFNAGLETGTIDPQKIHHTIEFEGKMSFADFVTYFYESRQIAKEHGDRFLDIFYKLILNSSYGKFAQNPLEHKDCQILPYGEFPADYHPTVNDGRPNWEPEYILQDQYIIFTRPVIRHSYYNVATAASITGGSRALLLRGIAAAKRPLYCDTDSIICEDLKAEIHAKKLGAWKHEGNGSMIAIAGKKLYAVFDDAGLCIKQASKGARLEPEQIRAVASGDVVKYRSPVPAFRPDGNHMFIERTLRMTA